MLVPILLKAMELWVLSLLNTQAQYRQPLPKIHLCFFIGIERSIRDADGTKVLMAFYERSLD